MNSLTTISVSAGSYFVKEGTVDLIHFGTIDLGKAFGHSNQLLNYKGLMIILI
mgnify:FL=1